MDLGQDFLVLCLQKTRDSMVTTDGRTEREASEARDAAVAVTMTGW